MHCPCIGQAYDNKLVQSRNLFVFYEFVHVFKFQGRMFFIYIVDSMEFSQIYFYISKKTLFPFHNTYSPCANNQNFINRYHQGDSNGDFVQGIHL